MDKGEDWGECKLHVEREIEQKNKSKKGWHAVQGKELRGKFNEEKFKKVVATRKAQGMYYEDDLFPGDDDEAWFFMRVGDKISREDVTTERTKLAAASSVDPELRAALTDQDEGILRCGVLPKTRAMTQQGNKQLQDELEKAAHVRALIGLESIST